MTATRILAAAILSFWTFSLPAAAQDGPTGVAIVEAPEGMGLGMCMATTPAKGFSCAAKKCAAEAGDMADQCTPVRWCLPARFGASIVINNSEGFTYSEHLCNENDEAGLVTAARAICDKAFGEGANGCAIAAAWDLDGKALTIEAEMTPPAQ